jgi:hypothetical protein
MSLLFADLEDFLTNHRHGSLTADATSPRGMAIS